MLTRDVLGRFVARPWLIIVLIIVMEHAEMCRLIIARHFKLKALEDLPNV